MPTGTVTWVDPHKGNGFITSAEGVDVYVPSTAVNERLVVGATVEFEPETRRGHILASNVVVITPRKTS